MTPWFIKGRIAILLILIFILFSISHFIFIGWFPESRKKNKHNYWNFAKTFDQGEIKPIKYFNCTVIYWFYIFSIFPYLSNYLQLEFVLSIHSIYEHPVYYLFFTNSSYKRWPSITCGPIANGLVIFISPLTMSLCFILLG